MEYSIAELILLFFIYACLGWCAEVAFAACKRGRFVNRGFLNGPLCPIYGFGLLTVVLLLRPYQGNLPLLFLGSFILTSLLELVTGFVLEKLFHTRWWDYTGMPLNIGGYVCLLFSLIWGAACVVILKWVHAPVYALVRRLPLTVLYILDAAICLEFAVDLAATVVSIRKLSERLKRLTALAGEMHSLSDELGESIAEHTIAAKERYEEGREHVQERRVALERRLSELHARREALLNEKRFGHRRLLEAFPNMTSLRHGEALAHLREAIRSRKKG